MTVNPYFQEHKVSSEQDLVENIIIETIQLSGFNIYYIPRTEYNPDLLLNEDVNSRFESFHKVEVYLNNATNYGGDGFGIGKFGMFMDNTMEFVVARRRFRQEVKMEFPKEGDLLYIAQNRGLFEIMEVDYETAPYYQLQKNYVFTLKTTLFSYSYETFDTGLQQLDTQVEDLVDAFKDNEVINDEARDNALSFDEENPFGDLTE